MKRRVVKVGGSLLADSDLSQKLNAWLAANDDVQNVIVVGGGVVVDQIRDFAEVHRLTDQQSHDLACRAMSGTARLVFCLLPNSCYFGDLQEVKESLSPNVIFDTSKWILKQSDVPESWDFTSDSIAARLAMELCAEELVLLKYRAGDVSDAGFVDPCFAEESKSLNSVRVCTLNV